MSQLELFAALTPPCGECHHLDDKPIDSGIRYCSAAMSWRWAHDRVAGCVYRGRPHSDQQKLTCTRAEAIRDLLESPRHSISEKDLAWLRRELRTEEKREGA